MDVQCERCQTEYEFDDALVSARGTTVRCTQCGHQFKVRRSDATDATGDRWVVQTTAGPQLTFLTLRELQRAILAKQVARHDMLLLTGAGARPLASIAELEPFFDGRASSRPPPAAHDGASHQPAAPAHIAPTHVVPLDTPSEPLASVSVSSSLSPSTPPPRVAAPAAAVLSSPPAVLSESSSGMPHPTARSFATPFSRPADEDSPSRLRAASLPPSIDEPFEIPGRRRVGGWVVAFVLLLAVGIVGWVVAKPYLVARNDGATTTLDARARAFLAAGESAMAEGNLDVAQQNFDKASVLAEGDPRVLLDEARVAAALADVPWLELRLLSQGATEATRTATALLDERLGRARKAADDALSAAPDDPEAARAKIDALRLAGERDAARAFVPKVGVIATQPETLYVLASLDLAEPEPFWMTVIDRLRRVALAEGNAGRARAALVYALAKFGDAAGAKTELAKLDAQPRPYPLLAGLHTLVDEAVARADRETDHDHPAHATAARAEASAPAVPAPGAPMQVAPASADGIPSDSSLAMQLASQAIKRADLGRARRIYEALAARNPADSEALAGIGDVNRLQGDTSGAIRAYRRALAVNPSYLPALIGVADTEWASGDRASAQGAYKDIADRFPEGTYPSYVASRAESASSAPAMPSASAAAKPWDPGDGI